MSKKVKSYVVMSKEETTPGAYANPTIADAVQAVNVGPYKNNQAFQERSIAQLGLDQEHINPGIATDDLPYSLELRGSGKVNDIEISSAPTAAQMPRVMRHLSQCGFRITNPLYLKVTGLTVGLAPGTLIYGEVSGALGRLLRKNATGEAYLMLEVLSGYAFLAGETLKSGSNIGTTIGTVTTSSSFPIIGGPYGWLARPISESISKMKVATASDFVVVGQGYGDTVRINVLHTKTAIPVGKELTGATSGAKVRTIEPTRAVFELQLTSGIAVDLAHGTTVTGLTSGATSTAVGHQPTGATSIFVKKVNATAFTAGEILSWSGVSGSPTLQSTTVLAGLQQTLVCQVVSGTLRANEALLDTGAPVDPTITFIEQEFELSAVTVGSISAGTSLTGATSGAVGTLKTTTAGGSKRLLVRRTTAAQFQAGENLTGSGLGTAPNIATVNYTLRNVPFASITLKGATSGAFAEVVQPNQAWHYGLFSASFTTLYPRVQGDQQYLYFRPAGGTFIAGENLINVATGDVVKVVAATLDISVYQGVTMTHEYNLDSVQSAMVGARGSAKLTGKAGEVMLMEFRVSGRFYDSSDQDIGEETAPSGLPDYGDMPRALRFENMYTGLETCVDDLEIDFAVTSTTKKCGSSPDGVEQQEITGKAPTMSMSPELSNVGVHDWVTEMRDAANLASTSVRYLASPRVAGNTWTFCAENSQIVELNNGERDSIAVKQVKWRLNRATVWGDDFCWMMLH